MPRAKPPQNPASELIYRPEDRRRCRKRCLPPASICWRCSSRDHPALLICRAGLPAQDTQHIISMSLFASGLASILQIKTLGPVGSGLLSIQGTSFNFVSPLIMGGLALKTAAPTCRP